MDQLTHDQAIRQITNPTENRMMRLRTAMDIPSDAVIENYRPALNTQTKAGQEHQY